MAGKADESFSIDNGAGNGYEMFYKKGRYYYRYGVTFENGTAVYSRTERIKAAEYNKAKESADILRYY